MLAVASGRRLLNWGIATVLRVLRREPLERQLSGRAIAEASAPVRRARGSAPACTPWCSLRATGATADVSGLLVATLCGFALASSLAMFSVVLPAGVGVREGLLVLMLAPVSSTSAATAVVVLSRFLTVLADVLFALLGWAYARSPPPAHLTRGTRARPRRRRRRARGIGWRP